MGVPPEVAGGESVERRPVPHGGKAEVVWEETGTGTPRAAGVGGPARGGSWADGRSATSLGANHVVRGVCGRALEPRRLMGRLPEDCHGHQPDWGNPTVRDDKGGLGKHDYGGTVNPPCNRKSRTGNPPPTVRAPES